MKKVKAIRSAPQGHWVGDGFPVRSLFSYSDGEHRLLTPFLLLDYAGPAVFEPSSRRRGVGEHPHRGFETVTIVYEGEVDHRDSTGAGGHIGPGDVQWMTAAGGILHSEFHSDAFTQRGGTLEMVQLWVNLPATAKMSAPGYQTLLARDIPVVSLPEDAGSARVIAGALQGHSGPARTTTPMNVWDLRLNAEHTARLEVADGHTLALVVLDGHITVNGEAKAAASHLVLFEREGSGVEILADTGAKLLLLSGEPIDEPVVGYGPFVMNTKAEIVQAIEDFNTGRFGAISAA